MSQPKMFTKADLNNALENVGSKLRRRITGYLIGGCAMTFMGRKVATKDVDIVFGSTTHTKSFMAAMQLVGFKYVREPRTEYSALRASAIMEDSSGMRFDIFDRQVCRALELTGAMRARAHLYQTFRKLDVYLMAPEDIFLFKRITERAADLDDMRILAEVGLNWKTIEKECLSQRRSEKWAYMLGTKLLELKAKFEIKSPIIKSLMDYADLGLLTYVFGHIMGEGENTLKEIAQRINENYKYSTSWTRKQLIGLVKRHIVGKKRAGTKGYVYYMIQTAQS
jgi:hypothetical protein